MSTTNDVKQKQSALLYGFPKNTEITEQDYEAYDYYVN